MSPPLPAVPRKYTRATIRIGLPEPVRLLHLSDTHLTLADGRDNERKRQLASRCTADFAVGGCNSRKHLEEALAYAKEHAELIANTGDLIDFISYRNLDLAREFFSEYDCVVAAGNHEFSKYVGEAWEDEAYSLIERMEMCY